MAMLLSSVGSIRFSSRFKIKKEGIAFFNSAHGRKLLINTKGQEIMNRGGAETLRKTNKAEKDYGSCE